MYKFSLLGKHMGRILFTKTCVLLLEPIAICVVQVYLFSFDCIGGVMIRVLSSSAVDRGFEPRSAQTKDYKIGICCFSAKHTSLRRKSKDWLAQG